LKKKETKLPTWPLGEGRSKDNRSKFRAQEFQFCNKQKKKKTEELFKLGKLSTTECAEKKTRAREGNKLIVHCTDVRDRDNMARFVWVLWNSTVANENLQRQIKSNQNLTIATPNYCKLGKPAYSKRRQLEDGRKTW
jgi:hypothetical protein